MAYKPLFAAPPEAVKPNLPTPKVPAPKKGGYVPLFAGKPEPKAALPAPAPASTAPTPRAPAAPVSTGPRVSVLPQAPKETISPKGVYGPVNPTNIPKPAPPKVEYGVLDSVKRFGANVASGVANAAKFAVDFASERPVETIKKVTGGNALLNAIPEPVRNKVEQGASKVIRTVNKPVIETVNKAAEKANELAGKTNVVSPEWEKATTKEKLTKRLPETAYYLAPQIAGSLVPYLVSPTLGLSVSVGSTAEQVRKDAEKNGVDPKKAQDLGLATGLAVGVLDRIIPSKTLGGAKNQFIGGLLKRLTKSAFGEGATEAGQEAIQLAAEKTFREDLGWDEAKTRIGMSFFTGVAGGTALHSVGALISTVAGGGSAQAAAQTGYKPLFAGTKPTDAAQKPAGPTRTPGVTPAASPSKDTARQIGKTLEDNVRLSQEAKPELVQLTNDLAIKYGGKAVIGPDKTMDRVNQKATSDYGGDSSRNFDFIRSTVEVDSVEKARELLKELGGKQTEGRAVKDFFSFPTNLGYVGMMANPKLANGHIGEIQINLPEVLAFKENRGRAIKRELDDLNTNLEQEGRFEQKNNGEKVYSYTASEKQKVDALYAESNAGYRAALKAAASRSKSSSEMSPTTTSSVGRKLGTEGEETYVTRKPPSEVGSSLESTASSPASASGLTNLRNRTEEGISTPTVAETAENVKPPARAKAASRVFERLQAENADLEGDLSYNRQNLKKNAEKAVDLVAEDRVKAYRIAMGVEDAPEDQTATAINIALAEKALEDGNRKLYSQLTRQRSLAQTRRGQEVAAEKGSVTDNSTSRYVKELIKARLEKLGKSYLGSLTAGQLKKAKSRATAAIDAEVEKVQKRTKNTKELDLAQAQKFLDSLVCT